MFDRPLHSRTELAGPHRLLFVGQMYLLADPIVNISRAPSRVPRRSDLLGPSALTPPLTTRRSPDRKIFNIANGSLTGLLHHSHEGSVVGRYSTVQIEFKPRLRTVVVRNSLSLM
jgi:hypothetical protein